MRAGAEGQTQIEQNRQAALRVVYGHPLRDDQQFFPHGQRAVILFPGVFPILIRHVFQPDGQGAEIAGRVFSRQLRQKGAQRLDLPLRRLAQIQAHLRKPLHPFCESLINIIPVFPRGLQKIMKLPAIVYEKAVEAGLGQLGAQQLYAFGAGADGQLCPLQRTFPLFKSYFTGFPPE